MKTETLQQAIDLLMPAVDTKGLVKEFTYLHFKGKSIEATDGAMLSTVKLEEETPKFAVDASVLYNLVKTVTEPDISFEVREKELVVRTKRIVGKLLLPEEQKDVVLDFGPSKGDWKPIPEALIHGLLLCRFTACTDQTSGALTGVRIAEKCALSCDRFRISHYVLDKGISKESLTVPVGLIDQLGKRVKKLDKYVLHQGTLYFALKDNEAVVAAKLLQGDYPEENLLDALKPLSEGEWDTISLTEKLKDQIVSAVERQNLIQGGILEFDRSTEFKFENGTIKLFSNNQLIGSVEETLQDEGITKGIEFEFMINPVFLLKAFEEADCLLYSKEFETAAFTSDKFKHLIKTRGKDG